MLNTILIVCLLILFGVALMLAEVYLIPGFGIAGLLGMSCIGGGVAVAYLKISVLAGHWVLVGALLLLALFIVLFMRGRTLDRMALKTDIDSKVDLVSELPVKVGDEGVAVSRLAPMGSIMVNDNKLEARSLNGFIDENEKVVITKFEGNIAVVKKV